MDNIYRIEKIEAEKYSDEDWKAYFKFRLKCSEYIHKTLHFNSWENLKERCINASKEGFATYKVWKNQKEEGHILFRTSFKNDAKKRKTDFINNLNEKSLDESFLKLVFEAFNKFDSKSNSLVVNSINGENDFIEKEYNAYVGESLEDYELDVKTANIEKMETWLQTYPNQYPNFRLEFYKAIPNDLLEEYSDVFTELLDDMPKVEHIIEYNVSLNSIQSKQIEASNNNKCSYRYLIFNEDDKLIAKTNVFVDLNNTKSVGQYMTGVLKEYRGMGLGKWLKAAMFKKLVEDFKDLEKIKTDTSIVNHGSRELSKQMGYIKTGFMKDYLISKEHMNL